MELASTCGSSSRFFLHPIFLFRLRECVHFVRALRLEITTFRRCVRCTFTSFRQHMFADMCPALFICHYDMNIKMLLLQSNLGVLSIRKHLFLPFLGTIAIRFLQCRSNIIRPNVFMRTFTLETHGGSISAGDRLWGS